MQHCSARDWPSCQLTTIHVSRRLALGLGIQQVSKGALVAQRQWRARRPTPRQFPLYSPRVIATPSSRHSSTPLFDPCYVSKRCCGVAMALLRRYVRRPTAEWLAHRTGRQGSCQAAEMQQRRENDSSSCGSAFLFWRIQGRQPPSG